MSRQAANGVIVRLLHLFPLAVCCICLAPFARLLTSDDDEIVSDPNRDYGSLHLPLSEFARQELLAGRLPLWNPYVGCGHPLHAAQQTSLCYPFATPLIVACGANRGLKLSLFSHLAIYFAGAYFLARRLDISPPGAAYAAMVATWSGALMGHLAEGHVSMVFQSALVPWFFLGLLKLLASPGPAAAAQLAAIGSLCALADHPQILYYTFVGGALVAIGSLCAGRAARQRGHVIGWGSLAAMTVVLIAAVQLLPAIELTRDGLNDSDRGSSRFAGVYALDGADVARLLMPYLNGTPLARVPQFDGNDHYHERVVYLGIAAPMLAVFGLSRAATAGWQQAAAWNVVLALAIAFGESTPAFAVLQRALPGLSLFRCPGRVFCVASLPAALLAGKGLDALIRREGAANGVGSARLAALLLAGANLIAYAAIYHMPSFDGERYVQYLRTQLTADLLLWAILALNIATAFVATIAWRLRGWIVLAQLFGATAVDLGYFNVGNFRMEPRERAAATRLPPADPMARSVDAPNFPYIIYDGLRYCRRVRATIRGRRLSVGTYDGAVLPGATAQLYRAIEADAPRGLALAGCAFIWSADDGKIKPLPNALPRLRFVQERNTALVDANIKDVSSGNLRHMREDATADVRLVEDLPCQLAIDIDARATGRLVLADTWYPGWRASIDGSHAVIERANGVFRSVRIHPGRHRVVFRYDPASFRLGLIGSSAGIILLFGPVLYKIIVRWKCRVEPELAICRAAANCRGEMGREAVEWRARADSSSETPRAAQPPFAGRQVNGGRIAAQAACR